jgi:hypothetical protein
MTVLPQDKQGWWQTPDSDPQAALATDARGLSNREAASRLDKFGPNLFHDHQERSLLVQFLSRFKNPLVILLLVASGISALTGDVTNFLLIACMVLFSVTLDFVQEHRAGKAAASLRQSVSVRATVVRDGKPMQIPVTRPIAIDYDLEQAGVTWQVYDVSIDGISLVVNFRNQFAEAVRRDGIDGLIKALHAKNGGPVKTSSDAIRN